MAVSVALLVTMFVAGATAATDPNATKINVQGNLTTSPLVPDIYGYSIEPVWLHAYTNTSLANTLLTGIANVTGKPPPIRVGGNSADQTYFYASPPPQLTDNDSVASPDPNNVQTFNITPGWFKSLAGYFPPGTDIIYTLNFADNSSNWANAVAEAEAAHAALGDSLVAFELGNEVDHFINKGWRDATWGVNEYVEQFRTLTGEITGSTWYQALSTANTSDGEKKGAPTFQAGVIADPPLVPDQQDEIDDFDIVNLTAAGIVVQPEEKAIISSYATHLYPQSTCDDARRSRLSLDLLSNHAVLWQNVSQYVPEVAAAEAAGAPLVMGETNSVSCGGRSGISDVFGAALWAVDYVLTAASIGFQKVYFHLGAQSEYSAFTPLFYIHENETLAPGIRALWYAHYFVARAVRSTSFACNGVNAFRVAALPDANSSSLSGFAIFGGNETHGTYALQKLVFLDMGVWNGTSGLSNPSTLSSTDGTMFTEGRRPVSSFEVTTSWARGVEVGIVRLSAPGTNAKSNISVAETVFDNVTGLAVVGGGAPKLGEEYSEYVRVDAGGVVRFNLLRAEAVLLEAVGDMKLNCSAGVGTGTDEQPVPPPVKAGSFRTTVYWTDIVIAVLIGVVGVLAM